MIDLDTKHIKIDFKDRFNLICLDNFIDENSFKILRDNYPPDELFENNTKFALTINNNSDSFKVILDNYKKWFELINEINSKEFKEKILKIFNIKNIYFEDNNWRKYIPFFKKAKFEVTFNKSKNGSYNDPHTDSTRKIVSMVIFFTSDNWTQNNGGLVKLFKPKQYQDEDNWRNKILNEEQLINIKEIFPKPNRIYGFKKTKNSYHSVTEVKCNENESRNVLMINLSYANQNDIPYTDTPIFKKIIKKIWKN